MIAHFVGGRVIVFLKRGRGRGVVEIVLKVHSDFSLQVYSSNEDDCRQRAA